MLGQDNCDIVFENNDQKEVEKFVGIENYCTSPIKGIGGVYKYTFKDFIVKEIISTGQILDIKEDYSPPSFSENSKNRFTTFNLIKVNKSTFEAIREVSKALKIPSGSIHYSGLKDKRSISAQKISIGGDYIDQLSQLKIRDVFIRNIHPSKKSVKLGSHNGNNFEITIRNIKNTSNLEGDIQKIVEIIVKNGIPNYFGLQRFGSLRPNSHLMGFHLLNGDYEKAYEEFITRTYSTESPKARKARNKLKMDGDFEKALEYFPKNLNYEYTMIYYLKDNPGDYKGAIDTLPTRLKMLLISSFQSYIFNKLVSSRLKKGISLSKPVKGDTICILEEENGNMTQVKYVYGGSYDKYLDEAIKLNRGVIVAPLVGINANLDGFPLMKNFFDELIQQEGIEISIFNSELFEKYKLRGSFRPIYMKPSGLKIIELAKDELHQDKMKLIVEFSLVRGSYATLMLRELMK